jgi:mannose-6-phosphate isomerase
MNTTSTLFFTPQIHHTLWGYESWVLSAHQAGESIVRNLPLAGKKVSEIIPDFPLLFKMIDAKQRLSVQVHPNESTCLLTGGAPKTEMWCVISGGPIFAGLKSGVTKEEVASAAADGGFENLLIRHDAQPGDVFFIPGGLVHAIGEGVKLFEVQQSSDTTFRLYDWGRKDAEGRSRELHIEQAMKAIDLTLDVPTPQKSIESRFFNFSQMRLDGTVRVKSGENFLAVFNAGGDVSLDRTEIPCGEAALLPPGTDATLSGCGAWVMTTRF